MENALLTFFNYLIREVILPIRESIINSNIINDLMIKCNHLINRLLGLFNNNIDGDYVYLSADSIATIIGLIIASIALGLIIKIIKSIIQSIASWISGDTIIITNVRERRKRKNKRG